MGKVGAIIVAFSAICLIVEANLLDCLNSQDGERIEQVDVKLSKADAYKLVSSHLVKLVNSDDVERNKGMALRLLHGPNAIMNEDAREILEYLVGLNDNKFVCKESRLRNAYKNLGNMMQMNKDMSAEERSGDRLSRVLGNYLHRLEATCGLVFEKKWLANRGAIQRTFVSKYETKLKYLDNLNREAYKGEYKGNRTDLQELAGAYMRYNETPPNPAKLIESIRANAEYSSSAKLLKVNLIQPCKSMLKRSETKSILMPVADLGMLITLDNSPNRVEPHPVYTWAARQLTCRLLLEMGTDYILKYL